MITQYREPALSAKDRTIVQALADGLTQKEIAQEFQTSHQVIKNRVRTLRNKTGMDTACAVVAWALRHGVIT